MKPHLGGVGVPVRSAHRAGLHHRTQPTFPMSTGFQSAFVGCAAFSGFHTKTDR